LVKTFWGWGEKQLPDGTLILTSPSGHTYVTSPGSALLFLSLCLPTGTLHQHKPRHREPCPDRRTMMPRRNRTRAQNRAQRIATERQQNHQARMARRANRPSYFGPAPPPDPDDPPPF
jgi:hypothetical protein